MNMCQQGVNNSNAIIKTQQPFQSCQTQSPYRPDAEENTMISLREDQLSYIRVADEQSVTGSIVPGPHYSFYIRFIDGKSQYLQKYLRKPSSQLVLQKESSHYENFVILIQQYSVNKLVPLSIDLLVNFLGYLLRSNFGVYPFRHQNILYLSLNRLKTVQEGFHHYFLLHRLSFILQIIILIKPRMGLTPTFFKPYRFPIRNSVYYLILLYISLFQIRIMIEPSQEQLHKRRWQKINRVFLMVDISFAAISLLVSFITIPNECSMSFFLLYTIYFMGQSIQHFLVLKMPKIDVIKYDITIKRYVYIASAIEILYFFVMFMFLVKTELHPIYCFLCIQLGISPLIGILLIAHFIVSLFMYIQFLYKYINRKYYLLALGGFEVEVRLNAQIEQNMRRAALIEPYYNEYPVINEEINKPSDKLFKFEDIRQDVEGEEVCSICLTREKEGFHPIYTPCHHYFHRECIENWAKINGKCPQCRAALHEQDEADINAELYEN